MDGGCLVDATNEDCHSAFLRRLLPRLEGLSPLDAGAGLAGDRSDAGVGGQVDGQVDGQVGRAFEVGDVAADAGRDVACGPDACPGRL